MTDPDLAKVRVFMVCVHCGSEKELSLPRIAMHEGRLAMKLPCGHCQGRRIHRLNPLKLPPEDA